MTKGEQEDYLRNAGWDNVQSLSPWRWYQLTNPGLYYRLADAVSLELSRQRVKGIAKGPRKLQDRSLEGK
jgi:hypothetical protein